MLVSACGACQNESWLNLADYEIQCPAELKPPPGVYPEAIDKDTAVPNWAYLNVSDTGGSFIPGLASLAGDSPESTYMSTTTSPVPPTSTLPPSTTSTTPSSSTLPPTSTTTSQTPTHIPGGGSSHVGAIAGGAVGGMIGLLLVAILGTLFYRRKKGLRRQPDEGADATTGNGLVEGPDRRSVQKGDRMSNHPTVTSGSGTLVTPQPLVPYDPAQFGSGYGGQPNPQSPTSPISGNQTSVTHQPPPEYSQFASGRYTGVPELE